MGMKVRNSNATSKEQTKAFRDLCLVVILKYNKWKKL